MKEVVIICPWGAQTGGPEALHQLGDRLLSLGFNASIFYTIPADFEELNKIINAQEDLAELDIAVRSNIIEAYEKYKIPSTRKIKFNKDTIIVIPETYLYWHKFFKKNTSLIWWLSVDNAFSNMEMLKLNLNSIRRNNVYHAYQSLYAKKFIESLGIYNTFPLSDYTPLDLIGDLSEKKLITMSALPHKVSIDLEKQKEQIEAYCNIEVVLLRGLQRNELYDYLSKSYIYIDFGNFPGKDRMPREALVRNSCVITSDSGAAKYNEFIIPEEYVINSNNSGLIKYACKNIVDNFSYNIQQFMPAKNKVLNESYIFTTEVFNIFSILET